MIRDGNSLWSSKLPKKSGVEDTPPLCPATVARGLSADNSCLLGRNRSPTPDTGTPEHWVEKQRSAPGRAPAPQLRCSARCKITRRSLEPANGSGCQKRPAPGSLIIRRLAGPSVEAGASSDASRRYLRGIMTQRGNKPFLPPVFLATRGVLRRPLQRSLHQCPLSGDQVQEESLFHE